MKLKKKKKGMGGGRGKGGGGIYIKDRLCEDTKKKKKKHCQRGGQKKTSIYERDAMHHQSNYHTSNNVGKRKEIKKINHYKYDTPKANKNFVQGKSDTK